MSDQWESKQNIRLRALLLLTCRALNSTGSPEALAVLDTVDTELEAMVAETYTELKAMILEDCPSLEEPRLEARLEAILSELREMFDGVKA